MKEEEKTRERILQIAKTWAGLREDHFIALLKEEKINGKFDRNKWDLYLKAIRSKVTEHKGPRCEICDAPMTYRRPIEFGRLICSEKRSHTAALFVAKIITALLGKSQEEAIAMARGKNCVHGVPLSECRKCGSIAMQANIEKNEV